MFDTNGSVLVNAPNQVLGGWRTRRPRTRFSPGSRSRRRGASSTSSSPLRELTMLSPNLISILSQMVLVNGQIQILRYRRIPRRLHRMIMFDNDYDRRWHRNDRCWFETTISQSRRATSVKPMTKEVWRKSLNRTSPVASRPSQCLASGWQHCRLNVCACFGWLWQILRRAGIIQFFVNRQICTIFKT